MHKRQIITFAPCPCQSIVEHPYRGRQVHVAIGRTGSYQEHVSGNNHGRQLPWSKKDTMVSQVNRDEWSVLQGKRDTQVKENVMTIASTLSPSGSNIDPR